MPKRKPALRHEDTGKYAELSLRANPDGLVLVFSPSLAALLSIAEREKRKPLTKTEVNRIKDSAPAIAVTSEQAAALVEDRGYEDVDPQRAFDNWQEMNEET
ncbi:MAG: hypothetical protein R3B84_02155 [Zavarzinella sp.]